MTETLVVEPVRKSIEVELPPLDAFQLFTSDMAAWWPPTHKLGATPFVEIVVEPHVGGGWFEVDQDGSTCQWGSILAWEPPHRVVFAWGIGADWKFTPDLSKSSEVELRFLPMGDSATLVEFEHRNLERHESGDKVAESVRNGWDFVLAQFSSMAGKRAAGKKSRGE
jgi:uncharacterized protein YndB with AHSA1/START domain